MCTTTKNLFQDRNDYKSKGALKSMSDAIGRGLVLVMSIWDDGDSHMQWLDGTTPPGSTKLGAARGTCPPNSGIPS
jgi:cellulose 1,4-beta-cellobiosidase